MDYRSKQIAKYNDQFRQNFASSINQDNPIQGKHFVTSGISSLPILEQLVIIAETRKFDDFNEHNDPYGEHNLGSFKVNGNDIIWKIDYYDTDYEYGSEDPSDLSKTRRVLTIMLAHEY